MSIVSENANFDQEAAAAYLNVSTQWLENRRQDGSGPPFAKLGRRIIYRKADLDAFVAQRLVNSTRTYRK
jgi:Helix-turn-helix domain